MFALFLHFATQISVFYSQTSRHNYGCPVGLLADKRLTDLEISSQASGEQQPIPLHSQPLDFFFMYFLQKEHRRYIKDLCVMKSFKAVRKI